MTDDFNYQAKCQKCGKITFWDPKLGANVLCEDCWDTEAEEPAARSEYRRAYYLLHKEREKRTHQEYYRKHKQEYFKNAKEWRKKNREALNDYMRNYMRERRRNNGK